MNEALHAHVEVGFSNDRGNTTELNKQARGLAEIHCRDRKTSLQSVADSSKIQYTVRSKIVGNLVILDLISMLPRQACLLFARRALITEGPSLCMKISRPASKAMTHRQRAVFREQNGHYRDAFFNKHMGCRF